MKPLYIFDLDDTLALNDHRKHFIEDKKNQRWDEFYRACVGDRPNKALVHILCHLWEAGNYVYIFSGRSDMVKEETKEWLAYHCNISTAYLAFKLKMRRHWDDTPDEILKKQWYDELPQQDKDRLVCVFDYRQKVVDMWRSIGVTCLQVAKGDF